MLLIKKWILVCFFLWKLPLWGWDYNKVVIWGHKLHSHTHSYIHHAFFRAFQEMGYPVYWFDYKDDIRDFDFSHTLFITEGQADRKIPIRSDCFYVLHHCNHKKYNPCREANHVVFLEVYTDDVLTRASCERVAPCVYYDFPGKCLYMPWATDLLPREIEDVKRMLPKVKKNKTIAWVGTLGSGEFGNEDLVGLFVKGGVERGLRLKKYNALSMEKNIEVVASSYLAPAIVGKWQAKQGYIPCRIFKNISYGQIGVTNSVRVYELFEGKIVYNPDPYQLFFDAEQTLKNMDMAKLYELMDFVKEKHTYINRIQTIIDFVDLVQKKGSKI